MAQTIGVRDLRENLSKYINKVDKGEEFVVMRKSEAVFKIVPVEDELWEEVIDFTKFKKGGIDIDELIAVLDEIDGKNKENIIKKLKKFQKIY